MRLIVSRLLVAVLLFAMAASAPLHALSLSEGAVPASATTVVDGPQPGHMKTTMACAYCCTGRGNMSAACAMHCAVAVTIIDLSLVARHCSARAADVIVSRVRPRIAPQPFPPRPSNLI